MNLQQPPREPLLTVKQLACELNRSEKFVYRMKHHGFTMPGGTARLTEAREWLVKHHPFRRITKPKSV